MKWLGKCKCLNFIPPVLVFSLLSETQDTKLKNQRMKILILPLNAKEEMKSVLIYARVNIDVFNLDVFNIDVWFGIPVC